MPAFTRLKWVLLMLVTGVLVSISWYEAKAGLGYMLPEPIKSEMSWIYGLNVIRTNYHLRFVIEPVNDSLVSLRQGIRHVLAWATHSQAHAIAVTRFPEASIAPFPDASIEATQSVILDIEVTY